MIPLSSRWRFCYTPVRHWEYKEAEIMRYLKFILICLMAIAAAGIGTPSLAGNVTSTTELFRQSSAVQSFFGDAYGYAVFPTIGKGGIGIGAAYGKGKV